jgi:hypothetical protein
MTLLNKTNTLVIVPAYNEQDSIVSVIEEIKATGFPFVVIDDGSTDETRNRAIAAGARTVSLPFNAGVGAAMKCGMNYALTKRYKAIIQCDADGQHKPKYFQILIHEANKSESVIVIGSRFNQTQRNMSIGVAKNIGIRILSNIFSKHAKNPVTDPTSGFRVTKAELIRKLVQHQPNFYLADTIYPLQMASILGLQVSEVSVQISERTGGTPSTSYFRSFGYFFRVLFESQTIQGALRHELRKSNMLKLDQSHVEN